MPDFLAGSKILIIDNEAVVVEVLRKILEAAGFHEISSTTDSRAAIDQFLRFQPDLVVLDLLMPGLSGLEVLAQLREVIPAGTNLPILVVTGDASLERRRLALAGGASDFVTKPYDATEILARIGNLLETRFLYLQIAAKQRELETHAQELTSANLALEKEREFLAALLENLQEGIVACDAQGVLTLFNPATRKMHGLPEEPIPATDWAAYYDLFLADGKTPMAQEDVPLFRALQGERVQAVQMVIAPRSGSTERTLEASGRAIYDDAGRKLGAVIAMRDITEKLHAEEALRTAAEKLQTIFDAAPLAILGLDPAGEITNWNAGAQRMFGWTMEETIGRVCATVLSDGIADFHLMVGRALRTGPQTGMFRLQKKKCGEHIHATLSAAALRNAEGQAVGVMVIVEDISQRVAGEESLQRAHAELVAANERLLAEIRERQTAQEVLLETQITLREAKESAERANAAKSEFLSRMSHELRTPLHAILGFGRLLEKTGRDPVEADNLQRILQAGRHLLGLVDEVLAVSRMEAGEAEVSGRNLPVIHASPPVRLPPTAEIESEAAKTLLYLDADLSRLRLIAHILTRRPAIRLRTAATGALGLSIAREARPDLILLDRDLPEDGANQVLRGLQEDPLTAEIPVAILTAQGAPEQQEEMLAAGVRAFLTKPVEVRALLGVLDQFVKGPGPSA